MRARVRSVNFYVSIGSKSELTFIIMFVMGPVALIGWMLLLAMLRNRLEVQPIVFSEPNNHPVTACLRCCSCRGFSEIVSVAGTSSVEVLWHSTNRIL